MNKRMRELIIDNYFSESDMKVIDEIEKIEILGKKEESDLVKKPVDYVDFCEDIENISNDLSFKLNREPTIDF